MGATPSLNTTLAQFIASSKHLTKFVLRKAKIPTPLDGQFTAGEQDAAVAYLLEQAGKRQVVKPVDGRQGRGITTGVSSPKELQTAWTRAMNASESGKLLVEEEVPGVDVRIIVVRGRALAAATRIPPFIVGDGQLTARELIAKLQEARNQHVYLKDRRLKPDARYLARHGVTLDAVVDAGRVQFLNGTANLSQGGIAVDLTTTIPREVLELAEHVCSCVPGLGFAGVDILMPSLSTRDGASVIEINTSPNLLVHDAPAFGTSRSVAAAVADALVTPPAAPGETDAPRQSKPQLGGIMHTIRGRLRRH
ncbi:hypothetical protein LTI14_04555 [Nesterenkonia sp. YGD6]|uniref:hypothetical protein n=1 Tax=Nesterenkonia sp. YGD6 TaxID=2901231 RepID=UPI001F4D2385|nr:hypothetical protein [Nesterenkonia sp. YGD6]MCH8562494.1 hypothetical protein [Nesterenkonia sp. YGD6]